MSDMADYNLETAFEEEPCETCGADDGHNDGCPDAGEGESEGGEDEGPEGSYFHFFDDEGNK
jgi:hypothetical protein